MTRVEGGLPLFLLVVGDATASLASEPEGERGRFVREYWYEAGIEHGNPRTYVHGIEILLPGPALVVRTRGGENGGTP